MQKLKSDDSCEGLTRAFITRDNAILEEGVFNIKDRGNLIGISSASESVDVELIVVLQGLKEFSQVGAKADKVREIPGDVEFVNVLDTGILGGQQLINGDVNGGVNQGLVQVTNQDQLSVLHS